MPAFVGPWRRSCHHRSCRCWCRHRHRVWLSHSRGGSQPIAFETTLWIRHLRLCPLGGHGTLCSFGGVLNPLWANRVCGVLRIQRGWSHQHSKGRYWHRCWVVVGMSALVLTGSAIHLCGPTRSPCRYEAGQPTGVENRGDAPRLPVFALAASEGLGYSASRWPRRVWDGSPCQLRCQCLPPWVVWEFSRCPCSCRCSYRTRPCEPYRYRYHLANSVVTPPLLSACLFWLRPGVLTGFALLVAFLILFGLIGFVGCSAFNAGGLTSTPKAGIGIGVGWWWACQPFLRVCEPSRQ